MKKIRVHIDLKKIFSVIFSKKIWIAIGSLFLLFKGYQIYLYLTHHSKAEQAVLRVKDLYILCSNHPDIEKNNKKYFYHQQNLAVDSISEFYTADSHIWGPIFFREGFFDDEELLYKELAKSMYAHCSNLSMSDRQKPQEQLDNMEDKMVKDIRWFD